MMQSEDANSIESICRALHLPPEIQRSYSNIGVKRVYDWQRECLLTTNIIQGNNLVYCAPTSGGKTLVAELLLLRNVLVKQKKVIFVLPYVSLVTEKELYLTRLLTILNLSLPMRYRIKVRGFHGDQGGWRSYKEHILVCTIEKANGILNSLVMRSKAQQLGCVLFDEIHVLGNTFNGYLLEILISKIKFMGCQSASTAPAEPARRQQLSSGVNSILSVGVSSAVAVGLQSQLQLQQPAQTQAQSHTHAPVHIQMIAMSATMGNVAQLATWLGGSIYCTEYRPVPLIERIVAGNEVLDAQGRLLTNMQSPHGHVNKNAKPPAVANTANTKGPDTDPDHMILLSQQALHQGQQVLVFCASKYACLQSCKALVDAFTLPYKTPFNPTVSSVGSSSSGANGDNMPTITHMNLRVDTTAHTTAHTTVHTSTTTGAPAVDSAKRQRLIQQRDALLSNLLAENPHLEETLRNGIMQGVAYHNAGLSSGERQLVEKGFRSGAVSILCATSTLAAGVNLPAGRVLIRSLNIGKDQLNVMQYKQMCGRAGRMGQGGNIGESFLLVKHAEKMRAVALSTQQMPNVVSQLHPSMDGGNALLKALLEVVGLGLCGSVEDALVYMQQTLLYAQSVDDSVRSTHSTHTSGAATSPAVNTHADVTDVSLSILKFLVSARIVDCDTADWSPITTLSRTSVGSVSQVTATTCTFNVPPAKLKITRFGRAIMQANIDPDEAIVLYDSLLRAQDGLHLESTLHLLYLVTPLEHKLLPNFRKMLSMYEHARSHKHALASVYDAVGVEYAHLNKYQVNAPSKVMLDMCTSAVKLNSLYSGGAPSGNAYKHMRHADWTALSRCKRLWAALALQSVLDGKSLNILCNEFGTETQDVEHLLHSAQIMCHKATRFCSQIGWTAMERMLTDFQQVLQLDSSDSKELTRLMRVPMMPRKVASVLCEYAHICSIESFAIANPATVVQLLQLSIGFEVQELDNIEVNIESLESRSACGGWRASDLSTGTQHDASTATQCSSIAERDSSVAQCSAATAETAHSTATQAASKPLTSAAATVVNTRDEHTKQRLTLLVTTLQISAREVLRREALTLDYQATAVMAALQIAGGADEARSAATGSTVQNVAADAGDVDDDALSEISTRDNDVDSDVSAEDLGVADEVTEERDAMLAIAADMQQSDSQQDMFAGMDTGTDVDYMYTADEYGYEDDALITEDYRPMSTRSSTLPGPAAVFNASRMLIPTATNNERSSVATRSATAAAPPVFPSGPTVIPSVQSAGSLKRPHQLPEVTVDVVSSAAAPLSAPVALHVPRLAAPYKDYAHGDDRSPAPKSAKLLSEPASHHTSQQRSQLYSQYCSQAPATAVNSTVVGRLGQYPPPSQTAAANAAYVPRINMPPSLLSQQSQRGALLFPPLPHHTKLDGVAEHSPVGSTLSGATNASVLPLTESTASALRSPHKGGLLKVIVSPLGKASTHAIAEMQSATEPVPARSVGNGDHSAAATTTVDPSNAPAVTTLPTEFQFTISDEDLNALMEELESSGVLEFLAVVSTALGCDAHCSSEQGQVSDRHMSMDCDVDMSTSGADGDEGTRIYSYYPLENPHIETVYDVDVVSPTKNISLPHALSSSAFKLSVQRISVADQAPQDAPAFVSPGTFEREVSKLMDEIERHGSTRAVENHMPSITIVRSTVSMYDHANAQSQRAVPVPMAGDLFASTEVSLLCHSTTDLDYFYGPDTTDETDFADRNMGVCNEDSRDSAVSCSDLLKTDFAAGMTISQSGQQPVLCTSTAAVSNSTTIKAQLSPTVHPTVPTASAPDGRVSASKLRFAHTEQRLQRRGSPYATPFTPSKIITPGRYLYCPLWQHDSVLKRFASQAASSPAGGNSPICRDDNNGDCSPHALPTLTHTTVPLLRLTSQEAVRAPPALKPCYPSEVIPADELAGTDGDGSTAALGFGMRRVSNPAHCKLFLQQLLSTRCVSFELLYRPLPARWLASYRAGSLPTETATGPRVYSWTPYISWACCKLSSVTSSANDHFLDCSLGTDVSSKRNMFRHPHVLVGAALSFGDSYGYYLPLPCPLPLPPNPYSKTATNVTAGAVAGEGSCGTSSDVTAEGPIECLPERCRELIVRYVGFGLLLNKCPGLNHRSTIPTDKPVPVAHSNPLFLVSRRWSYSARRALLVAWRLGACTEWRTFADIMQNSAVTKVAMHLKSKLVVLRERDVVVEGPIEDPSIANVLRQQCSPNITTSAAADTVSLQIPTIAPTVAHTKTENAALQAYLSGQKVASFRAVAVFRAMAQLESRLRSCNAIDLFRNIEMLLCYCTSDAEYSGLCVDAPFFSRLRQCLKDRQQVIEQYFSALYGDALDVSSPGDVALLKRRLVSESGEQLQLALNSTGATGTVDVQAVTQFVSRQHPLLRLISEHRSHVRTLPLCTSILSSRCFDRVRAVYSTIGTETGRIILTNPPLQQVPKQCSYLPAERASLHEELMSGSDANQRYALISYLNSRGSSNGAGNSAANSREQEEWVSVVSLGKTTQNLKRLLQQQAQEGSAGAAVTDLDKSRYEEYSYGRLVRVLDSVTISAAPAQHPTAGTTDFLSPTLQSGPALADVWHQAGYTFTAHEMHSMCQVLVEFPHSSHSSEVVQKHYAYPADKVFRCNAGHKVNAAEVGEINAALRGDWILSMLAPEASCASTASPQSTRVLEQSQRLTAHTQPSGSQATGTHTLNPRDGFRASDGFVLLAADYSQIELRILAHFSGDPDLLQAFTQGDVFTAIAARWLNKDTESITPAERNQVKQICYTLIYGAGPSLVAESANITLESAQALMRDFLARYPGISKFLAQTKRQCKGTGYVETLLGRRRYLPNINSADKQLKSKAERQAVNTLCQGSAADLIKLAMINIHTRLAQLAASSNTGGCSSGGGGGAGNGVAEDLQLQFRRPRSNPGGGLYKQFDDVRPVLQVHDELVFEVRHRDVDRVAAIVQDCMEHAVVLNVPLQVKLSSGATWGSLSLLSPLRRPPQHSVLVESPPAFCVDSSGGGGQDADARMNVDATHTTSGFGDAPAVGDTVTSGAPASLFATVMSSAGMQPPMYSLQPLQQVLPYGYHRASTQNAPPPQVAMNRASSTTAPPIVRDLFGRD